MKTYSADEIKKKCTCELKGTCPHCTLVLEEKIHSCFGCQFVNCKECSFNNEILNAENEKVIHAARKYLEDL